MTKTTTASWATTFTDPTRTATWNNPTAMAARIIAKRTEIRQINDNHAVLFDLREAAAGTPVAEVYEAARKDMALLYDRAQTELGQLWGENNGDAEVIALVEAAE